MLLPVEKTENFSNGFLQDRLSNFLHKSSFLYKNLPSTGNLVLLSVSRDTASQHSPRPIVILYMTNMTMGRILSDSHCPINLLRTLSLSLLFCKNVLPITLVGHTIVVKHVMLHNVHGFCSWFLRCQVDV